MVLDETINQLLRNIIHSIIDDSGFNVIRSKQNAPRPEGSYADVDILVDTPIGWEDIAEENEGEDVRISTSGARTIMVSIGFYRDNAKDYARKVRDGFARITTHEALRAAKLGLNNRSPVRDVSEVLESKWEERAQFDLTINAVGNDSELISTINAVIINGGFQTRGKTIPINVEVNT